jgi:hypothetical protein
MKLLKSGIKDFNYYEDDEDAWTAYTYFNDFSNALEKAMYDYNYGDVKDYYYDMGIKKSDKYIIHLDNFNDFMWDLGYGVSESYWDIDKNAGKVYYGGLPCENAYYEELKRTGDYWWFLVCVMQKFSSPADEDDTPEMYDVYESIREHYSKFPNGFSFEWFFPLKGYLEAKKLENEFSKTSLKSLGEYYENVDFSSITEADISAIPEYEIEDSFVNYGNKYYNKMDVFLAITASGGLAQSLERQDLEGKVTTVGRLRKNKKKSFIGVKQ